MLGKKKDSFFAISNKRFFLTSSHLLYTKDEFPSPCGKIRGGVEINWARVSFESVDLEVVLEQGYGYKMSITRNNRFTELYIREKEAMLELKSTIRRWCINDRFYDDFDVIKKLGSGAFASVSLKLSNISSYLVDI